MERNPRASVLLAAAIVAVTLLLKLPALTAPPTIEAEASTVARNARSNGPFDNYAYVELPAEARMTASSGIQLVQYEEPVTSGDETHGEKQPEPLRMVVGPDSSTMRRLDDARKAVASRATSEIRFVSQESEEDSQPEGLTRKDEATTVVALPDVDQYDDMEIIEPPVARTSKETKAVEVSLTDTPEMEIIEPKTDSAAVTVVSDLEEDVIDQIDEAIAAQAYVDPATEPQRLPVEKISSQASSEIASKATATTRKVTESKALVATSRVAAKESRDKLIVAKHKDGTAVVDLPEEAYEVASNTTEETTEEPTDGEARVVDAADAWYLPIEELTPEHEARRQRIRQALEFYYNRMLNTTEDSPWSMMHHMIAWGADSYIWAGNPGDKRVSCIGWLCANGKCEGARLLEIKDGKLTAKTGPGLQGHGGQFLAMLAQARVRSEQPIRCDGEMFTVEDLIQSEKERLQPGEELTFKMIGLIHYLGTESSWKANNGQQWDFPRMIREEIKQPINGTTCGGTHRLMGLSYAVRRRIQEGYELDGQWARAAKYTADYREYAFALRNSDGTFSSDFFRSRGSWGDLDRKVKTNGHVLEWMVFSSPHDELQDPRLVKSIDILTSWLSQNRYYDWGKGPMAHAVRALSLYDERVYGGEPGKRTMKLASRPVRIQPKPPKAKTERQMMMEANQPQQQAPERNRKSPSGIRRLFRRGGGWH